MRSLPERPSHTHFWAAQGPGNSTVPFLVAGTPQPLLSDRDGHLDKVSLESRDRMKFMACSESCHDWVFVSLSKEHPAQYSLTRMASQSQDIWGENYLYTNDTLTPSLRLSTEWNLVYLPLLL